METAHETTAKVINDRGDSNVSVQLVYHGIGVDEQHKLTVTVIEFVTGVIYEIPVPDNGDCMDVFYHPYCYMGTLAQSAQTDEVAV